ncbi:RT0821/Lpp0805 family surface protein [Pseudovibrio japonicus]|nr:RT0821/Lpp0805 family surface protein [Pseudovibrio japonicus]
MSISVNQGESQEPLNLTEGVGPAQNVADNQIDRTDRTAITDTIEEALNAGQGGFAPMAWRNPVSGNSGTITALMSIDRSGSTAGCTDFVTSANTVGGITAYQGRSCPDNNQKMRIVRLAPLRTDAARPE